MNPCEVPCPKCGAVDVYRRFHKRDERIDIPHGKPTPPGFTVIDGYKTVAMKDLILQSCRCCGFQWADKPLKKPRSATTQRENPDA